MLFRTPERLKGKPTTEELAMIIAVVTFQLPKPTNANEMAPQFEAAVPMFQKVPGLLTRRDRTIAE